MSGGHHHVSSQGLGVAIVLSLLVSACSGSVEPGDPDPGDGLRLEAVTDTNVTATVGARVTPVPVVRLTTLAGAPAPGFKISFRMAGGGSIGLAWQNTDTAGMASPGAWHLGTKAGPKTLTAHAEGLPDVVFTATAQPGPAATIRSLGGNGQTGVVGATLPDPLRVSVADAYGNPVAQAPVTFEIISGGGRMQIGTVLTDLLGQATSGGWTLGATPGAQQVRAQCAAAQLLFEAFACGNACREQQILFLRDGRIHALTDGVVTLLTQAWPPEVGEFEGAPAWSPDGQRVAFERYVLDWDDAYLNSDLYLMAADGSQLIRRATGFHSPAWSPDGRWIAVIGGEALNDLYLLSVEEDGTAPVHLAALARDPTWAPDGTRIAFVAQGDASSPPGLAVMNTDGSGVTLIGSGVGSYISYPAWSPDGQHIAFSECLLEGCSIHVVNPDGTGDLRLTPADGAAWSPTWSPDGVWIAFATSGQIDYIAADGSSGEPIPMASPGDSPAWRP